MSMDLEFLKDFESGGRKGFCASLRIDRGTDKDTCVRVITHSDNGEIEVYLDESGKATAITSIRK